MSILQKIPPELLEAVCHRLDAPSIVRFTQVNRKTPCIFSQNLNHPRSRVNCGTFFNSLPRSSTKYNLSWLVYAMASLQPGLLRD
jgi:hypothetical protein